MRLASNANTDTYHAYSSLGFRIMDLVGILLGSGSSIRSRGNGVPLSGLNGPQHHDRRCIGEVAYFLSRQAGRSLEVPLVQTEKSSRLNPKLLPPRAVCEAMPP